MDNGDNGASGMHDSFLTGGQYIVHAEDGEETLGISGDSMDAGDKDGEPLREQDRFLPIANVARIMKNAIPKTGKDLLSYGRSCLTKLVYQGPIGIMKIVGWAMIYDLRVARLYSQKTISVKGEKIAKDAKECVQECVSEFVSFITSEASDRCHQEKRKTINGEDILFAMSTLGFDNYVDPLKLYLQKYREAMKGEKTISTATATDCSIEDLEDNSYSNQNLAPTMLPDQNNVIYTTAYTQQDSLNLLLYNNNT